jgi:hypothetical protein
MLTALRALKQPGRQRLLVAGVCLALALLTRPVAQSLLPLLPAALLLRHGVRAGLKQSGWFALGLATLLLPWMLRNAATHGSFSPEGALGQALIGRTVRHDDYQEFYACPPTEQGLDPRRVGALRIICEEAQGEPSGGVVTQRVRDELGLSQAETSAVLRQVALEAIAKRPAYFLSGTLEMTREILVGKRELVLGPWRERTTRNWDNKWDSRLTPLVKGPPPASGPELERAEWIISRFQPFLHRTDLGRLLAVGLLAAALIPAWRASLMVGAAAGIVILASAALDGSVWRYRYPADPLLAIFVGGAPQAVFSLALWLARPRSWTNLRLKSRVRNLRGSRPNPLMHKGT